MIVSRTGTMMGLLGSLLLPVATAADATWTPVLVEDFECPNCTSVSNGWEENCRANNWIIEGHYTTCSYTGVVAEPYHSPVLGCSYSVGLPADSPNDSNACLRISSPSAPAIAQKQFALGDFTAKIKVEFQFTATMKAGQLEDLPLSVGYSIEYDGGVDHEGNPIVMNSTRAAATYENKYLIYSESGHDTNHISDYSFQYYIGLAHIKGKFTAVYDVPEGPDSGCGKSAFVRLDGGGFPNGWQRMYIWDITVSAMESTSGSTSCVASSPASPASTCGSPPTKKRKNAYCRESESLSNTPSTEEECNQKCADTEGCVYFALGQDSGSYSGQCFGCPGTDGVPNGYLKDVDVYEATACAKTESTPSGGGSGDPHLKTWNGHKYDYHGECDLVLVDNPQFANGLGLKLHIRTTRVKHYSFIERAALKIGSDVLEFANDLNTFTINGKTPSPNVKDLKIANRFQVNRLKIAISVRLDEHAKAKVDFHQRKNGMMWVNVDSGSNPDLFTKSLGMIGQYESGAMMGRDNSTVFVGDNNVNAFANEWQVQENLDGPLLFQESREPQYPAKCLPPKPKVLGSRLGSSRMKAKAEKICSTWNSEDQQDCIFDVINTRSEESAEEPFDVEHHIDFRKASYSDVISYVRYLKEKAGPHPNHHHHAQGQAH